MMNTASINERRAALMDRLSVVRAEVEELANKRNPTVGDEERADVRPRPPSASATS